MSTPNKNLGTTKKIAIYVEGSKLGRDFAAIKNFTDKTTYVEGVDSYLGEEDEIPWQIPVGATGSFEQDELDAKYVDDLMQAIRDVETSGKRPDIVITRTTYGNDGTTSKVKWVNVTIQDEANAPGRTEKAGRKFTWRSSKPRKGS